jgi:hypothetical protein
MANPDKQIRLTIYNQGTSLVRDRRTIYLLEGTHSLDFTDVTAQIDAASVTFAALSSPDTAVLEQNYLFDLVGTPALLQRYLEQKISITTDDGTTYTGALLGSAMPTPNEVEALAQTGEVILKLDDGQVVVVRAKAIRDIRFPALPGGLITRPTLRWLLRSKAAGPQQVEITYLTGGLNWTADYNLLLAVGNASFDLNGWVTLTNTSGAAFEDAQVKLVAGEVKRLPTASLMRRAQVAYAQMDNYARPSVEQREIFEYQLYEIKRPVTVNQNETKQVEFVRASGVKAETTYVFNTPPPFSVYSDEPIFERTHKLGTGSISAWLEFTTGKKSGLDADLPAGRVRAYQADQDGSAVLIGENRIGHTPKGEKVKLELGRTFDLIGERRQTTYQQQRKNVLDEGYAIKLRNRKDSQSVTIRVPERLFRWSNWEILSASHPYTKLDSATIEFRVDVPAGEEVVIAYTVRYSWMEK